MTTPNLQDLSDLARLKGECAKIHEDIGVLQDLINAVRAMPVSLKDLPARTSHLKQLQRKCTSASERVSNIELMIAKCEALFEGAK